MDVAEDWQEPMRETWGQSRSQRVRNGWEGGKGKERKLNERHYLIQSSQNAIFFIQMKKQKPREEK